MASRMCSAPGVGASTMPSHLCFCCSIGGGVQVERMRSRAGTFIPIIPICFSTASGSNCSEKLKLMRVGGVDRHQDGVERMTMNGFDERVGAVVSGDAEIFHDLLIACLEECFHRSALGEGLVDV